MHASIYLFTCLLETRKLLETSKQINRCMHLVERAQPEQAGMQSRVCVCTMTSMTAAEIVPAGDRLPQQHHSTTLQER